MDRLLDLTEHAMDPFLPCGWTFTHYGFFINKTLLSYKSEEKDCHLLYCTGPFLQLQSSSALRGVPFPSLRSSGLIFTRPLRATVATRGLFSRSGMLLVVSKVVYRSLLDFCPEGFTSAYYRGVSRLLVSSGGPFMSYFSITRMHISFFQLSMLRMKIELGKCI